MPFYCKDGWYNELASLMLAPPEDAIKQLFHMPGAVSFSYATLATFFLVYARMRRQVPEQAQVS